MRKVKFNRHIEGGIYQDTYQNEGMFTGWGTALDTSSTELSHIYTMVAMVELPDGAIEEVLPSMMRFINPSFIEKTKLEPIEYREQLIATSSDFRKQYLQNPEQPVEESKEYRSDVINRATEMVDRFGFNLALDTCKGMMTTAASEWDFNFISKVSGCIAKRRIMKRED